VITPNFRALLTDSWVVPAWYDGLPRPRRRRPQTALAKLVADQHQGRVRVLCLIGGGGAFGGRAVVFVVAVGPVGRRRGRCAAAGTGPRCGRRRARWTRRGGRRPRQAGPRAARPVGSGTARAGGRRPAGFDGESGEFVGGVAGKGSEPRGERQVGLGEEGDVQVRSKPVLSTPPAAQLPPRMMVRPSACLGFPAPWLRVRVTDLVAAVTALVLVESAPDDGRMSSLDRH
jgi:hypothetical protein